MLETKYYRLKSDILAISDGIRERETVAVPKGAIIRRESDQFNGDPRMVCVEWQKQHILMFAIDVRERSEELSRT
jgi:hypothetical protein